MSIKMIAVDMDGTFLDQNSSYDQERFLKLYKQMKERNIRFVVASGNPYYQLQNSFLDIKDELTYIAENGGYIVDQNKELFLASMDKENSFKIIEALRKMNDVLCWVCTKEQSYTLRTISKEYYQMFLPYFPGMQFVDDFIEIQQPITKFALYLPEKNVDERMNDFMNIVDDKVHVVDSGYYCVDLIPQHVNKGEGIQFLMNQFRIGKDEVMAFGDAFNDLEMLKRVTYGYVMDNAKDELKDLFEYRAPSNQQQGVLQVIEQYLQDGTFMNVK